MAATLPFRRYLFLAGLFLLCAGLLQAAVSFSFSLPQACATSAGVYRASDGVLVRTLWSNVQYAAGTHSGSWDGANDAGSLLPGGAYQVKVLSNNVTYTWQGVIGNTSANLTGNTVFHSYSPMQAMAIAGTTAFFCTGYNEQNSTSFRFATDSPPNPTKTLVNATINGAALGKAGESFEVTTDGTLVYWAGDDAYSQPSSFVYATAVANDTPYIFPTGVNTPITYAGTYNTVDNLNITNAAISGIAVQGAIGHNLLFVSRAGLNRVDVLDKTSGALIKTDTTTFTAPGDMNCDPSGGLWVICKDGGGNLCVREYSVDAGGNFTQLLEIPFTNFSAPLCLAVSPDGSTVLVTDGGASMQVKAFTTSAGAVRWIFGQAGGYTADATVADDKFAFGGAASWGAAHPGCVAFQPDGSFWIGDTGNARLMHYSFANPPQKLAWVMAQPCSYATSVDVNNPTRVFCDYKEFKIDYSKPLDNGINGSWSLVRNWGPQVAAAGADLGQFQRLWDVMTLANGRTYTLLKPQGSSAYYEMYELTAAGTLRDTGVSTATVITDLQPDGSLRGQNQVMPPAMVTWTRRALTGFDASGNPQYAAPTTMASVAATGNDPVYWGGNTACQNIAPTTSSNIIASFFWGTPGDVGGLSGWGYHLGGVKMGGTQWQWETSPSTWTGYMGNFPNDGAFDIGNGCVSYAGNRVQTLGQNIVYGYHGEFWKGGQTNKFIHYWDDGLLVGVYGVVGCGPGGVTNNYQSDPNVEAPAQMAGNTYGIHLVNGTDGKVYLYHNDESYHGGVHRWLISGLDTISEQTLPITLPAAGSGSGLSAEYFMTDSLNANWNPRYRTQRSVTYVDANPGNAAWGASYPAGVGLTGNTFSIRWTGYVKADYSETYTFAVNAADQAQLWVNGVNICAGAGAQSGAIALTAGISYAVRLEYADNANPNASISFQWSSPSQTGGLLQAMPADHLYPAAVPATSYTDLMYGMPEKSTVSSGQYGWARNPTADATAYPVNWQVETNVYTYQPNMSPDICTKFFQSTAQTYTVTRDLGQPNVATQWSLQGLVDYEGTNADPGNLSWGQCLQVLDDNNRVICRVFPLAFVYQTDYRMCVNASNHILAPPSGVTWTSTQLNTVMNVFQPLTITAAGANAISVSYAGYPAITVGLDDPTANWQHPKYLQVKDWTPGPGYGLVIDLDNFSFTADVVQTPVFTPAPGAYLPVPQIVTLSSGTPGAIIHYTLDGSTPTAASPIYTSSLTLSQDTTVQAYATSVGYADSAVATGSYQIGVAAPVLTPPPGAYLGPMTVALTCATPNSVIHYTLDGSTPTAASPVYTAPVFLAAATALHALATVNGGYVSSAAGGQYTITLLPCATPVFTPAPAIYVGQVTVTLTCTTPNAVIHYTTNGALPTVASPVATAPLTFTSNTVLKAYATASYMLDSPLVSGTYQITPQAAAPVVTPASGAYLSSVKVQCACATTGAKLYYTLDGSEPSSSATPYTGPLLLTKSLTFKVKAYRAPMVESVTSSATYTIISSQVATPTLTPGTGSYAHPVTVQIGCATAGAEIHYTLDGSGPTLASPRYLAPLVLSTSATLTVRAFKQNWTPSAAATAAYTMLIDPYEPDNQPAQAKPIQNGMSQNRSLYPAGDSDWVYFTLLSASDVYVVTNDTSGVLLLALYKKADTAHPLATATDSLTRAGAASLPAGVYYLQVLAKSAQAVPAYQLLLATASPSQVVTPFLSPQPGAYLNSVTVTLRCPVAGAVIRYTTDGSDPTIYDQAYTQPLALSKTTTIKARAYKPGYMENNMAVGAYSISTH